MFHNDEMFNVSYKMPSPKVPSPRKAIEIFFLFDNLSENAKPAAIGNIPP